MSVSGGGGRWVKIEDKGVGRLDVFAHRMRGGGRHE